MGRNSGGYTIIEVMIVLAITGLLFASAVLVFHGEQGRSGFSQSMQDLNSKIQSLASEISAGNFSGDGYHCYVNGGGNLQMSAGSGDNTDCVFLGRVMQINPGTADLQSYVVVGTRDIWNSGSDTGQLATNISEASPTVASTAGPAPVLEQDYSLSNNAKFVWSKDTSNSAGNEYDLLSLYNNLQGSGASSSSGNNLLMEHYQCNGATPCSNLNKINNCLDGTSGGCGGSSSTQQWFVCVQASNGQTALLEVDNTSSGIRTKLNFVSC